MRRSTGALEAEFHAMFERIERIIQHPDLERNLLMAIQSDVQKLIDAVAANTSLAKSIEQALQIQGKQIDDLKAQVVGLQAGQVLTVDDLTAIQGAVTSLSETNTQLQTFVPANTPEQTSPSPAGTPGPAPAA